jgi:hypothetical protein
MKTLFFLSTLTLSLASINAHAHADHDHGDSEKLMPATCAQLADKKKYTDDVAYPQVKELKARCDTEAKKPAK